MLTPDILAHGCFVSTKHKSWMTFFMSVVCTEIRDEEIHESSVLNKQNWYWQRWLLNAEWNSDQCSYSHKMRWTVWAFPVLLCTAHGALASRVLLLNSNIKQLSNRQIYLCLSGIYRNTWNGYNAWLWIEPWE